MIHAHWGTFLLSDGRWRAPPGCVWNRTSPWSAFSRYSSTTTSQSHLYLWVPNALILEGLEVMKRWGFTYKTNIIWHKVRKDGGPDGRGVGFYFRNVTELVLFGIRGNLRTAAPGRRQVNFLATRKREHSRKPDEIYPIIEACSYAPYLELFARHSRPGWASWGNEVDSSSVSRVDRAEQALFNPMYL
ncbi:MAG: MT-A70 family methyltransferase [Terracidiphilus sp.]